ncbi:MAG: nucleoside transporter C-terminal domain-containing protein [Saprospiraceae bacterium]|nr:nucleoside transporter C-terminal domain-containing protein [Saprospiraceae bacterium]
MDLIAILRGLLGIAFLVSIAFIISSDRKLINWRLVGIGLVMQLVLALMLIKMPWVRAVFQLIVDFFVIMIESTEESARFLFGDLAAPGEPYGFAFIVLPTIIFFSALSSLLYYLGILQRVVYGFAWLMSRTMQLSGAESLAAAANVFIGQTEAPLVVKPYLERMTRSEILSLMTGGMATIAGGVFGAYMAMLGGDDPEGKAVFGMHLLTASIISAPAAIVAAKIIQPETDPEKIDKNIAVPRTEAGSNLLDALVKGTTDGLKLAVNVGAMLLAFMAFVFLSNKILNGIGSWTGLNDTIASLSGGTYDTLSLEYLIGLVFSPIAWMIGISSADMVAIGQTLGEKTILNEFIAYLSLTELRMAGLVSERSIIIATYALCGFANFASIGIQIGGIGAIAPGQRRTLTEYGLKALIGGTLAALMTASIAGMLYP